MGFKPFVGVIAALVSVSGYAQAVTSPIEISTSAPTVSVSSSVASSTFTWRTLTNNAFQVGEHLSFSLYWGIILGGRSTLEVVGIEPINGRPAYHLVSTAKSAGLAETFYKTRDRNETWLDTQSLATVRYEKHIREGGYKVEADIELDQVNHRFKDYVERLDKGTTRYIEGDVPPYVMDILGSMFYIRTMTFDVGDSFVIDVYDERKQWPLLVTVKRREKIKVPAGKFDCFVVEPVLRTPGIFVKKGKKLEVWLTADPTHLPVMMRSEVKIGHVSAELVKYKRSADAPEIAPPTPAAAPPAPTPQTSTP